MSVIRKIGGFFLVALLIVLYLSYFIVNEKQKALVLRFGEISRVVEQPGLYLKIPFVDTVSYIEDRIMVWEINDRPVVDSDSQVYNVDAITLVRIIDPSKFRKTLGGDVEQARTRVSTFLDTALRQTYGKISFDAALSSDRTVIMHQIRDQVRPSAENLGIQIVDVRVRRTDLSDNVLDETYKRMESERNAIATRTRSEGEAMKTQSYAETDRAYAVKVAEARRQAEILKGEGDAERNKVFADAYQKDPEFFAFYRSMIAYGKSLGADGTTLVLDPNSEFFKYFGTQKDKPATQPTGP